MTSTSVYLLIALCCISGAWTTKMEDVEVTMEVPIAPELDTIIHELETIETMTNEASIVDNVMLSSFGSFEDEVSEKIDTMLSNLAGLEESLTAVCNIIVGAHSDIEEILRTVKTIESGIAVPDSLPIDQTTSDTLGQLAKYMEVLLGQVDTRTEKTYSDVSDIMQSPVLHSIDAILTDSVEPKLLELIDCGCPTGYNDAAGKEDK